MDDASAVFRDMMLVGSVAVLYSLMLLLGRRLKRGQGVQLSDWTYHLFSLCLSIYVPAKLLGRHLEISLFGNNIAFRQAFGAGMCFFGALFTIALVNHYVWDLYFRKKHRVKVPRFLNEVVTLLILVVSGIVILEFVFKLNIKGLVIGPSVVALVAGLAMQDLLGNIFSGLALQFSKSFKDGDWLLVNNTYAKVIDINWRTTRLLTNDDVCVDIPNRDMAKATIVNLNLPNELHAMRLSVNVDSTAPPTRVKDILVHATSNAKGISASQPPVAYLKNFGEYAVEYEIKFFMESHEYYYEVCDAIRTNIWYSFHRHGIKIPHPIRTVYVERPGRNKEQEIQNTARLILRQQPLFKSLTDEQLDALLPRGRVIHFGRGEKVIEQGAEGDSMFILVEGEANVVLERGGSAVHVASLRTGDCFGEMSLLTGERRSATILAHSDCEVVEIGKAVLGRSLKENPELLSKLSALLAKRQMETEGIVAANTKSSVIEATRVEYANSFMDKLRTFFEL